MIDKRTVYATLIDFLGIVLMFASVFFLPIIFMFVVPLIFYFITYKYFREKFWLAFGLSIVLTIVLIIILLILLTFTPLGAQIGSSYVKWAYGV